MGRPNQCHTCCSCTDGPIGFDRTIWTDIRQCYTDRFVQNIASDISKINNCCLLFAGNSSDFCGRESIQFNEGDWPKVKSWIERGGRLFLATEFEGCLGDPEQLEQFLLAMDTTIVWEGGKHSPGCGREMIPGDANISQGITTAKMAATAEMSGGDAVVFKTDGDVNMMVVERLGDGFLFVVGDGNLWEACNYNDCELALALKDTPDEDII